MKTYTFTLVVEYEEYTVLEIVEAVGELVDKARECGFPKSAILVFPPGETKIKII